MDAEDIAKDESRQHTRGMAQVWWKLEVQSQWLGVEGGYHLPSLNLVGP